MSLKKALYSLFLGLLLPTAAHASYFNPQGGLVVSNGPFTGTGSKLYDNGELHLATDNFLFLDAPVRVTVSNDLGVRGGLKLFNGGFEATGSSIYDNAELHIATDNYLFLDAPVRVTVSNDLQVNGNLNVTGSISGSYTVADNSITSAKIQDGTIVDVDINASAAIADTKLATISTAGKVLDSALSSNVALKNANNNFSAGQTITGASSILGSTDAVQLTVRGNSTQTVNVLAVQNSASTNLLTVANSGATTIASGGLTVSTGGASISGNSTITGTLTGLTGLTVASGTVSLPNASVADAALSSNVPLKNATNTFSAANTFTGNVTIGTSGTAVANVAIYTPSSFTPVATPAAVGTTSQTFTVTGLATTDKVIVNGPAPTSLCPMVSYRVSAANTLQLDFTTLTAAACTPAAGVYSIVAIR